MLDEQVKLATNLFENLSELMDRRLYLSRRLLSSFGDREKGLPDKTDERFKEYNNFLYEWNCSINKNICKLEQFFGQSNKAAFEKRIMLDFNWIGILLRRKYFNIENPTSIKIISDAIDITNERVYKLDQEMLVLLKSQKIGTFLNS